MSKKRVAYFYDEDVGNFHYGVYFDKFVWLETVRVKELVPYFIEIITVYLLNTPQDVFRNVYLVVTPWNLCTSLTFSTIYM